MQVFIRQALAASLGLAAAHAGAQSSVSISGTVDVSVRQVRNQGLGTVTSQASGANSTSKLVLRGQEDLGDGLSAGFYLDGSLLADTGAMGASGPFWDRRSTVSLASRQWGELRLGRDWVPTHLVWSGFDPFATLGIGSANGFRSFTASRALGQAFERGEAGIDHCPPGGDAGARALAQQVRGPIRRGEWTRHTSGLADELVQGNVVILPRALAEQSVTLLLEDEIDISRGDLIVKSAEAPEPVKQIDATVCWLSETPLSPARTYLLRHTTREVKAKLAKIDYRLDVNTLEQEATSGLAMNDIARVTLKLAQPIVADRYQTNRATGAFIIIDESTNNTVGAGMIG